MSDPFDSQPHDQSTPPRRSLFGRPWLGWVAAIIASGVLGSILVSDHNRMVDRLSAAEAEISDVRASNEMLERRVANLDAQLTQASGRAVDLRASLDECVRGLDNGVKLYNNLVKELNAAVNLNLSDFNRFYDKAAGLRKKANRSLDDCRDAAA